MRILLNLIQETPILYEITDNYILDNVKRKVNQKRIVNYLENSEYVRIILDQNCCPICSEYIDSPETLISDGNWVWSADLVHYVKNHDMLLPHFFNEYLATREIPFKKLDLQQQKRIFIFFKTNSNDYGLDKNKLSYMVI